jgi:murein DD-endopeptidase MepM/ murein hydrolase activator NlpD
MVKLVFVLSIFLLVTGCAPFQSYVEDPPQRYYLVQPDDNLFSIAFALEVTPGELRRSNPWVDPVYIEPGTRLLIPNFPTGNHYAEENNSDESDPIHEPNQAAVKQQHGHYIWPVDRIDVSSHYGRRRGRLHTGIDLRAPRGTPIVAAAAGRVIFSGYKRGYGHLVIIDHGGGIETAYAHNNRNTAKKGQRVNQGQLIARVGKSGNATGYHVHFEFRRHGHAINPIRYLQAAL